MGLLETVLAVVDSGGPGVPAAPAGVGAGRNLKKGQGPLSNAADSCGPDPTPVGKPEPSF